MRRSASEELDGHQPAGGDPDPTDDAEEIAAADTETAELTEADPPDQPSGPADPASLTVVARRREEPGDTEEPAEEPDDGFWADPEVEDRVPTAPRQAPWLTRWWARSDLGLYLASLLMTCFAAAQAIDLWSADLAAPFAYLNDATAILAHFKTVLETGWYEYQPMLGAPVGQTYHDFPQADNFHMIVARFLGLFSSNVAVVVNVYYLLTFPLAALAAVWFLRKVGVGKTMSLVLSVLFAIAPFHWEKNENHLFLAAYYPVPLALGVIIWVLRGEPLWRARATTGTASGWRRLRAMVTGRGLSVTLILLLIGTASSYYSVFTLILLAFGGLIALGRTRSWKRFGGAVAAGALLAATMLANMLPDILYSLQYGNNEYALVRDDSETERYALKLAQLLLPAPDHAFKPFRELRAWYDSTYPFVSERPALGLIAAVGFVGLIAFVLIRLGSLGAASRQAATMSTRQRWLRETLGYLALLSLVAFLFSTIGGLETLFSFLTDALRSWNRMSILIAAFALAAFGLAVDAFVRRTSRRPSFSQGRTRLLSAVLAGTVLIIGVWDQSTLRAIPSYATVAAQWNADEVWIDTLEDALPDGAMIFQAAYQPFPEAASVNGVIYTDALKPFLHSTTLRWSGGGMRGRAQDDWGQLVSAEGAPQMVSDLAVAGFEGLMIDRRTYLDAGASIEAGLQRALGKTGPDMASDNGRYTYYSLTGEAARLAGAYSPDQLADAADAVLKPVFVYPTNDFTIGVNTAKESLWTTKDPSTPLVLDNARSTSVDVSIHMVLTSPTGATQVMLSLGSQSWVVNLSLSAASAIDLPLTAPPGRSQLVVSPGPDSFNVDTDTRFSVTAVSVTDPHRPDLASLLACPAHPEQTAPC